MPLTRSDERATAGSLRNARLNARGHTRWLGIIRDVRTALKDCPLPVQVLKELLRKTA